MSLAYYIMDDLRLGRSGWAGAASYRKARQSGSARSWRRPWRTTGASPLPSGRCWA